MNMKSITILFGAAILSLGAVSCDSPREENRKDQLEQKADSLENTADAVRDNSETRADQLEDTADKVRDQQ